MLRSYFDTQLMFAESKGLVLRDYRTLWMGHKGDIEHTYTTNKNRFPPHILDDMREAYRKSQEHLQTTMPEHPKGEDLKRMFRAELLRMAGYTDEEMEKDRLLDLAEDKFRETVRERLLNTRGNSNRGQKVVSIDEIEAYVEKGWEFVTSLPNEKVIVRFLS